MIKSIVFYLIGFVFFSCLFIVGASWLAPPVQWQEGTGTITSSQIQIRQRQRGRASLSSRASQQEYITGTLAFHPTSELNLVGGFETGTCEGVECAKPMLAQYSIGSEIKVFFDAQDPKNFRGLNPPLPIINEWLAIGLGACMTILVGLIYNFKGMRRRR